MKQNSINTFNEGLNYDLNPLTTPNNVLTDAINATFLTFNGDELVLQNDAGNAKIPIPGTNDEFVTLNEGFYPIGMKEYGGVLYIISAFTKEDTSTFFNLFNLYLKDSFVYNVEKDAEGDYTSNTSFYRAKESNQNKPLPLEGSNENWELVGNYIDYINYNSQIQFGSYPSPEAGGPTTYPGKGINGETALNLLYKSIIINDYKFKSGRYISFKDLIVGSDNISYYDNNNIYHPKFYKVKLLHQMTNGFIDITDDIWKEFIKYKVENNITLNDYWFNDKEESFRYYCPHQYKGKLAIFTEIEELKTFKVWGPTLVDYNSNDEDNEYTFTLYVKVESFGYVDCKYANIEIFIDNELINTSTAEVINEIVTFIIKRPGIDREKLIEFTLTPKIYFNNQDITISIPKEYINKFTIKGTRILTSEIDFVNFKADEDFYVCNPQNKGFGWYTKYILVDGSGNNLDSNFLLSEENKYIFNTSGYTPEPNEFILATYEIINNKPVISNIVLPINNNVLTSFEKLIIQNEIQECLNTITINFNFPIGTFIPNIFKTNENPIDLIASNNNKTFTGYCKQSDYNVELEIDGYRPILETFTMLNDNVVLNYVLISDFGNPVFPNFNVQYVLGDSTNITGVYMPGVWFPSIRISDITFIRGYGILNLKSGSGFIPVGIMKDIIFYLTPSEYDVFPVDEGYNLLVSESWTYPMPKSLFNFAGIALGYEGTHNGQVYSLLDTSLYNNISGLDNQYIKILSPSSNDFYVFERVTNLLTF